MKKDGKASVNSKLNFLGTIVQVQFVHYLSHFFLALYTLYSRTSFQVLTKVSVPSTQNRLVSLFITF